MTFKEIINEMIKNYSIIFTGSLLGTVVFCVQFYPDIAFDLNYLKWMFIFAFLGDLPQFVFYSSKELTQKGFYIRYGIHIIILEIILLIAAHFLGFYDTAFEGLIFFLVVLGVYFIVKLVRYLSDSKTAEKINDVLKDYK